ncbi:MAG TPA: PA2779 family protein, partial [Steroidobacteraceae bacterium]|nr:PA2779 family protein [Steroidobacteraceae bacterium]
MKFVVGIVCVAILNMGMVGAASAAIVDTATLVTPDRAADMSVVRNHLDRADVRAKMEEMGIEATAVDRRLARLNDRELHKLAADMQNAPAGGADAVWIVGAVFIVLIILEL